MSMKQGALNADGQGAARSKGGWTRRRLALVVAEVAFVAWVIYAVGGGLWQANAGQPWSVPHALGDLELQGQPIQGKEAVAQMTELHGKDVELSGGYVAHYKASNREAMLYVGQAKSVAAADELTERMRDRIAVGTSPFKGLTRLDLDGREVFRVTGMGAEHYFFYVGDKAVWLSVAGGKGEAVLRLAVNALKE